MNESSLFDHTAHALKWNFLGNVIKSLLQFGISVLLARILGPKPFGLIGMAMVIIGFGYLISDAGFNMAVIQKEKITEEDIRSCFTVQLMLGLLIFLFLWVVSPIVSRFYSEPLLVNILPALGLSLFLQNAGMTAVSLLKKDLNFKRIQIIGISSFTVGYGIVGSISAIMGLGVWSLVVASITSVTLQSLFSYIFVPHSIRPSVHIQSYRRLFRFGGIVTATNVVNYIGRNMDYLISGKFFGAKILGFYTRAFDLTRLSTDRFLMALQAVIFPAYSKIQGQFNRIGRTYKIQIGLISLITMPLFWSMALCGNTIILGLFGEEWIPAGPPLRILCLAMPFHAIMSLAGPVLWSQDKVKQALFRQVLFLISISFAVWFGAKFGINGVAAGVAASYLLRYFLLSQAAIRLTGIGWGGFFRSHVGGLVLSIIPIVSLYPVDHVLNFSGYSPWIKLGVLLFTGILSVIVSVLFLPAKWFGEVPFWLYSKFGDILPIPVQNFFESWILSIVKHKGQR